MTLKHRNKKKYSFTTPYIKYGEITFSKKDKKALIKYSKNFRKYVEKISLDIDWDKINKLMEEELKKENER